MGAGGCPAQGQPDKRSIAVDNGRVTIEFTWTGDGVSQEPFCDGPVTQVKARNTGPNTWYAHLPQSVRSTKYIVLTPGYDETYSGPLIAAAGLGTAQAFEGLRLTQSPIPPQDFIRGR